MFMAVVLVSIAKQTMVVTLLMVYCTIVLPNWKIIQQTAIEESNTIVLEGGMVTTYNSAEQFSLKSEVKAYNVIQRCNIIVIFYRVVSERRKERINDCPAIYTFVIVKYSLL